MSYGKCWYSESPEPHSFFDVDHFRPKAEALRAEYEPADGGYPWLAFSWDNFRLSAQRSNRLSKDEDTEKLVGKGSWFPLVEASVKASWTDRCEHIERPLLLDPVNCDDVDLIDVAADGRMEPSMFCVGTGCLRVERSIEIYGLNLPGLVAARMRVMRDVDTMRDTLIELKVAAKEAPNCADWLPIKLQTKALRSLTKPNSPYSKAARARLAMHGLASLCARPEDSA